MGETFKEDGEDADVSQTGAFQNSANECVWLNLPPALAGCASKYQRIGRRDFQAWREEIHSGAVTKRLPVRNAAHAHLNLHMLPLICTVEVAPETRETLTGECDRLSASDLLKVRIAATIGETSDLGRAMDVALEAVCKATGWTLGSAWVPREVGIAIECCKGWYASRPGFESFRDASAGICLTPNDVLPGLAWERHRPVFIADVTREPAFRRREAAAAVGIKAGAAFPILVNDVPIAIFEFFMLERRGEDEKLVEMVGAATAQLGAVLQRKDLEERLRKNEAELARLNRIKDHFMAMLAHELRNPLTPILNAVEMLRSSDPGDAVDVIERQVKHMARLLDDLLDVSRVAMGKITLRRTRIDLADAVRAAARTVRSTLTEGGHSLSMTLASDSLWVDADPVRIEQVTVNLLTNAVKSTRSAARSKEIRVSLYRENSDAVLKVRDEGVGIPGEMLQSIFEPFVQLESAGHYTKGGLGLGLALVRQLVEMHGGSVTAWSEGRRRIQRPPACGRASSCRAGRRNDRNLRAFARRRQTVPGQAQGARGGG